MKGVELTAPAKRRLLEKVIKETDLGNAQWKYAFADIMADYYAEWRGRILTIRWLQDEGPRLRVFTSVKEALITYDPARNAVSLPRESESLVTCWEWDLSKLNRHLCGCITTYLKKGKAQKREQAQQRSVEECATEEIKEIERILNDTSSAG